MPRNVHARCGQNDLEFAPVSLHKTLTVDGEPQGFQPEDLLRQAQIQDVSLAPDVSTDVYSWRVIADNA